MIEHLVVVAAPSGGGKTALTRALRAGRLPEVAARLGLGDPADWLLTTRRGLRQVGLPALCGRVLFECNIEAAWRSDQARGRDEATERVLGQARVVSLVTLWTPPARLSRQRLRRGARAALRSRDWLGALWLLLVFVLLRCLPSRVSARVAGWALGRAGGRRSPRRPGGKHLRLLLDLHARPERLARVYGWWLSFAGRYEDRTRHHLVVEIDRRARFLSREELQRSVGLTPGAGAETGAAARVTD